MKSDGPTLLQRAHRAAQCLDRSVLLSVSSRSGCGEVGSSGAGLSILRRGQRGMNSARRPISQAYLAGIIDLLVSQFVLGTQYESDTNGLLVPHIHTPIVSLVRVNLPTPPWVYAHACSAAPRISSA